MTFNFGNAGRMPYFFWDNSKPSHSKNFMVSVFRCPWRRGQCVSPPIELFGLRLAHCQTKYIKIHHPSKSMHVF